MIVHGSKKGGNKEIRNLLNYIQVSKECSVTNDTTRELHRYVSRVKIQPEVRMEYMKFEKEFSFERLRKWHKLAAKAETIEGFAENI